MEDIDTDDHIIQRPFVPEQMPSEEELKRRHDIRKEQGLKLKEIMAKQREEKLKKMQEEFSDLKSIEQSKQGGRLDQNSFKEELQHRGFSNNDEFQKRLTMLMVKLNIKQELEQQDDHLTSSQAMDQKYNLLSIADAFLTQEQMKQKRIQKMKKTAAMLRDEKKRLAAEAKEKLESLKNSANKNQYLRGLYIKRKEVLERMQERSK